jgi:dihydrofolate reductase
MRKLNVLEFVSLDGVIQAPGGPEEDTSGPPWWIRPYRDSVSGAVVKKQMNMPFDLLLGRKTFDMWAQFWPQHNDVWPAVNTATKYETIIKIKQQEGPDLRVCGSANLVQTLVKHDLVDAFWLMIIPVTLGGEKRLFAEGTIPAAFKVTESTVTAKGVIIVNYERAGAVPTGSL